MEDINVFNIVNDIDYDFIEKNSDKILSDYLYINNDYPLYKYNKELWFENPLFDRDYAFYMQTLIPICNLLTYYRLKEDDRLIEKALILFYTWYEENYMTNYYKKNNGLTIALRLMVVCDLFTIVKKIDLCVLEDSFENVMLSHCAILENDKNYKQNSTIGLEQDIALFVSSIVLYQYYGNSNFLNLKLFVKHRIINQLNFLIYEDGSFSEHSVEQAYRINLRLIDFYLFIEEYGESEELCKIIKSKSDNLLIFIYAMLEPDGYLPNIGLGSYTKINIDKLIKINHSLSEHLKYICTNGIEGKKLLYQNVYFPSSNYFISVNQNEINDNFMKLTIYSHFNPYIEKHYDLLAFTFYHKNLPLFVDCGNYKNKERLYYDNMTSLYGHNSICVDKHDYLIDKTFMNKSGITNITIDNHITLLSEVSCLYEGILLRRNFLFIKNYYLIIIDEFDSIENHQYEIIFNINQKLSIKNNELEYAGYLDEKKYFSIKNLYCTEICTTTFFNGNKKDFKGFLSYNGKDIEPTNTVIYKIKCSNGLNISLITLNPTIHVSYQILNDQINFKMGDDVYSIIRNKFYRYLEKNGKIFHDEKTNNKALLNSINDFYRRKK